MRLNLEPYMREHMRCKLNNNRMVGLHNVNSSRANGILFKKKFVIDSFILKKNFAFLQRNLLEMTIRKRVFKIIQSVCCLLEKTVSLRAMLTVSTRHVTKSMAVVHMVVKKGNNVMKVYLTCF